MQWLFARDSTPVDARACIRELYQQFYWLTYASYRGNHAGEHQHNQHSLHCDPQFQWTCMWMLQFSKYLYSCAFTWRHVQDVISRYERYRYRAHTRVTRQEVRAQGISWLVLSGWVVYLPVMRALHAYTVYTKTAKFNGDRKCVYSNNSTPEATLRVFLARRSSLLIEAYGALLQGWVE